MEVRRSPVAIAKLLTIAALPLALFGAVATGLVEFPLGSGSTASTASAAPVEPVLGSVEPTLGSSSTTSRPVSGGSAPTGAHPPGLVDAASAESLRANRVTTAAGLLPGAATGVSPRGPAVGRKIALIIAIGEYGSPPPHPRTGEALRPYRDLNADNDVPLVRGALEHHGFLPDDIRVVQNADADVDGIRDAFRWLIRQTDDGDVVVLHYSGHGHRITNDNPDEDEETDGYDEMLVPYGAHEDFYEGYDGSLHIRDDELGEVVAELRERAGREGSVTVFLDACYSGTATRGDDDLPARGSMDAMGPPAGASATRGETRDDGTGIDLTERATTRGGGDDDLAAFAVFSAASQLQVAYETYDLDGETKVGSLSFALARALPNARPGTSNRALFGEITRSLNGKVNQTPQLEGSEDALLFSNLLRQQIPYVAVDSILSSSIRLAGGSLVGINAGTRLLVHPIGAQRPDPATAIAEVQVSTSTSVTSIAQLVRGELGEIGFGSWAFVTQRAYGDLALRVRLDASLSEGDRSGLERVFDQMGIISLVDEGADVVVVERDGDPVAITTDNQIVLGVDGAAVRESVENYARNRYLRRLEFEDDEIEVEIEFSMVGINYNADGTAASCTGADWSDGAPVAAKSLGASQYSMSRSDAYELRVRNVGQRRAFVAVLDLMPRGEIRVLRPTSRQTPEEWELTPGSGWREAGCYQIAHDAGLEVLKVFATEEPQRFREMFESANTRTALSDLKFLEAAIQSTFTTTRSEEIGAPAGSATTTSLVFRIDPNQE